MPLPPSARRHNLWSAALVERATRQVDRDRANAGRIIATHQLVAATQAQAAVGLMLEEQGTAPAPDAVLNALAFTTTLDRSGAMLDTAKTDLEFFRIVGSLVSDAGRAAEQASVAVRPRVGYVRYLSPPSCSRCAVLAGRVYRYSQSFQRHPGCDCTMIPTTVANPDFVHDPVDLMERGLVTGLSKADQKAITDGADFGLVVNVRRQASGLSAPGRVLSRRGKPTPEGIYAAATSRDDAIERLIAAGYVR